MNRISLCDGWLFNYGLPKHCGPFITNKEDRISIDLPHDFVISTDVREDAPSEGDSGYYVGNNGTYSKTFRMEDVSGTTLLDFDGVYQNAFIRVNKSAVYAHHYGYTPFFVDISDYLVPGENTVDIEVSSLPEPNSRWYSGGGIYRPVSLLRAGTRYVAPDGIYVRYQLSPNNQAVLSVSIKLAGRPENEEQLRLTVFDPNKSECFTCTCNGGQDEILQTFTLEHIQRWDIDSPNLYSIKCEILVSDQVIDTAETHFGMREIGFLPETGMLLNGKPIQLKGGNCHHLNGILGAAAFPHAEERKVRKMKECGFNAIRFSHNPPSREILDWCDKLGLLVVNELFDMWLSNKKEFDYHTYFDLCWREDVKSTLERDRNHPSIIIWSIGNEVQDPFEVGGYARAKEIADEVRRLDPDRWITLGGIVSNPMTAQDRAEADAYLRSFDHISEDKIARIGQTPVPFTITKEDIDQTEAIVDMIDLHYEYVRYPSLAKERPNSIIVGTENMGPEIDLVWDVMQKTPQVIGDFAWPCWDYIGEAGNGYCQYLTPEGAAIANAIDDSEGTHPQSFPHRTFGDGDFDMCGHITPMNRYRQIVWGSTETELFVLPPELNDKEEICSPFAWPHVLDYWTYPGYEGKLLRVEIYSRASQVELFLNGISLGKKSAGKKSRFRTYFKVPYQPGELLAVSYENGQEVSRKALVTIGKPCKLVLRPEANNLSADIESICYIDVMITDAEGNLVQDQNIPVHASVSGEGSLLAFGSAESITAENYTTGHFTSKNGLLQAIVRSNGKPGTATLTVTAMEYPQATCNIHYLEKE